MISVAKSTDNQQIESAMTYLEDVITLPWEDRDSTSIRQVLSETKQQAVERGDCTLAKRMWCYETALRIQDSYIGAYSLMSAGNYYEAWCQLERTEIEYGSLLRHRDYLESKTHIDYIHTLCHRFQSIYPYRLFFSPEYTSKHRCSVCGTVVTPRKPCGHEVGEIYDGEMCVRLVHEPEFVGCAIVEKPVQKYSVLFLATPEGRDDSYDYSPIKFALNYLRHPLEYWSVTRTRRSYPHSEFKGLSRNDFCPCRSQRK